MAGVQLTIVTMALSITLVPGLLVRDSRNMLLVAYVTSKALAKLVEDSCDCAVWKYKPRALAAMALFKILSVNP